MPSVGLLNWMQLRVAVVTVCVAVCVCADTFINEYAVHVEGGHHVADRVAREAGLVNRGQIGGLEDHYLFHAPHRARRSATHSADHHQFLHSHGQVRWFEQQKAKVRVKRDFHPRDVAQQMSVTDPLWGSQWYLHGGAFGGNDMNVEDAWRKGYTGKNIVVTILDDGLERTHEDLKRSYDPFASYDINNHDSDPMPRYDPSNENRHGTRCAGEVSAEANNTHCTVGIAPDSRIGGIRMLDGDVFDAVEAASLSFNRSHIDIYSASWGPDDDGKVVDGPGKLAMKAFTEGIEKGRQGKGSIFVWASGNGGSSRDSCNCDGYTNSIFTVSISSTSEQAVKPWYLEECSSTLATTYSSGAYNEKQIATTDLHNRCTTTHTGTSASAPLAAGIIALILEANDRLTWRDVQYITLMTARPGPIRDGQWVTNGLGRKVSLRYGYGLMDASAMVDLALVWNNVPEKHECVIKSSISNEHLDPGQSFGTQVETNGCRGDHAHEVNYLEHVQARVSLSYHQRGRLVIYLVSPSGTRSKLLPERPSDTAAGGFDNWPFLSVHFWGEQPQGKWTLLVEDVGGNAWGAGHGGGQLLTWSLVLHGTVTQPVQLRNGTSTDSAATRPGTSTPAQPNTTTTTGTPSDQPHIVCHPECQKDQCTGPLPQDCTACNNVRLGSMCVTECPGHHYATEEDHVCHPCDASCETCSGPTLLQCLSCPAGHQKHERKDKSGGGHHHFICSADCLPGYYLSKEKPTSIPSTVCCCKPRSSVSRRVPNPIHPFFSRNNPNHLFNPLHDIFPQSPKQASVKPCCCYCCVCPSPNSDTPTQSYICQMCKPNPNKSLTQPQPNKALSHQTSTNLQEAGRPGQLNPQDTGRPGLFSFINSPSINQLSSHPDPPSIHYRGPPPFFHVPFSQYGAGPATKNKVPPGQLNNPFFNAQLTQPGGFPHFFSGYKTVPSPSGRVLPFKRFSSSQSKPFRQTRPASGGQ